MAKMVLKFYWLQIWQIIRALCILLPEMSSYRRDFDQTKYIYFLIKDVDIC